MVRNVNEKRRKMIISTAAIFVGAVLPIATLIAPQDGESIETERGDIRAGDRTKLGDSIVVNRERGSIRIFGFK